VDCHYDRWFVVQTVDSDHPVSKLSPFVLDKAVRSAMGSVKTLRRLRNGDFLLEVASAAQSKTSVQYGPHSAVPRIQGDEPFVDAFVSERLRQLLLSTNDCLLESSP